MSRDSHQVRPPAPPIPEITVSFGEVVKKDGPLLLFPLLCFMAGLVLFVVTTNTWLEIASAALMLTVICVLGGHWTDVYFDIRFQKILSLNNIALQRKSENVHTDSQIPKPGDPNEIFIE